VRIAVACALLGALGSSCASAAVPQKPNWGVALEGNPISPAQISSVRQETGLQAALVAFFLAWPEDPKRGEFPQASVGGLAAIGVTAVITWEPMFYRASDGAETIIDSDAIIRGDYDDYIQHFAHAAADSRRPLLIRFAHEMNLQRYHWGSTEAAYGPDSPTRYRAMWRHVVDIFRRSHTTNVQFAFCPNCESVPGAGSPAAAPWNAVRNYYPGNDYVDVLGMDGYNWGDTQTPAKNGWQSTWRSFESIFAGIRAELRAIAPEKPLYVFETSSAATGGDKRVWLRDLSRTAVDWQLAGVVWFEVHKEIDWRMLNGVRPDALEPLRDGFGSR
jgi:mannan endo-1,4-beta-mannosidase